MDFPSSLWLLLCSLRCHGAQEEPAGCTRVNVSFWQGSGLKEDLEKITIKNKQLKAIMKWHEERLVYKNISRLNSGKCHILQQEHPMGIWL